MRFIGHLDWQAMQQALYIKAGFKIAIGEGPTRKLKMKTSPPTPVGVESMCEYTYLQLAEALYPCEAIRRLVNICPDGIEPVMAMDASHLSTKNPFAMIAAASYKFSPGNGSSGEISSSVIDELERIRTGSVDGSAEETKAFRGRILEINPDSGNINLLVKQEEGDTFHGAKCAAWLEETLSLPYFPIFTKLDYFRLKPSKRRLFT